MFKRIDSGEDVLEGFSYIERDGIEEYVKFDNTFPDSVIMGRSTNYGKDELLIYVEDIPKMVKALQAAYDYKKGQA